MKKIAKENVASKFSSECTENIASAISSENETSSQSQELTIYQDTNTSASKPKFQSNLDKLYCDPLYIHFQEYT